MVCSALLLGPSDDGISMTGKKDVFQVWTCFCSSISRLTWHNLVFYKGVTLLVSVFDLQSFRSEIFDKQ